MAKPKIVATWLTEGEDALIRGAAVGARITISELLRGAAIHAARQRMAEIARAVDAKQGAAR